MLFDVAFNTYHRGFLVVDEIVFITAEHTIVFVVELKIFLALGARKKFGDFFAFSIIADDKVRIDVFDVSKLFRDWRAKTEDIVNSRGETILIIIF